MHLGEVFTVEFGEFGEVVDLDVSAANYGGAHAVRREIGVFLSAEDGVAVELEEEIAGLGLIDAKLFGGGGVGDALG